MMVHIASVRQTDTHKLGELSLRTGPSQFCFQTAEEKKNFSQTGVVDFIA